MDYHSPMLGNHPLTAVIFDFDGLMVDTESAAIQWWVDKYAEYGLELSMELCRARVGRADSQWHPLADLEEYLGRKIEEGPGWRAEVIEVMHAQPLLPGVAELVAEATDRGVRLAIASSVRPEMLARHFERLGLAPYFQVIVTRADVTRVKPDPDIYNLALERLGIPADEAFALEDSLHGCEAAKAAGLKVVAVPSMLMTKTDFGIADVCLPTLAGQTLDSLTARLGGAC